MTASIATPPKLQFFAADGTPLVGGKVYSYAAGTTTPQVTYTDSTGGTANSNPVILDSRGEANIWFSASPYKLILKDSTDTEIWSVDNLNGPDVATLAAFAASSGAELVGFSQSASYSAGTVGLALQAFYNVKNAPYNATGDGSTDDTTAIQAALTAAASTGGVVFFPAGTYKISAPLTIASNTTLLGAGKYASLLSATNAFSYLQPAIYGSGVNNVRVAHLGILGNVGASATNGLGYGVSLLTGANNIVEDLYISDTAQAGIWCGEQTYLTIQNNYLTDTGRNVGTDNHGIGLYSTGLTQTHDVKVLNNTVIRPYRKGIATYSPNIELYNLLIDGNTVIQPGLGGIYGAGNTSAVPHRNYTITNNIVRYGYVNIELDNIINAVVSNNICDYTTNNHTGGAGYAGLSGRGLISSVISNNIVSNSDGPGLSLLAAVANSYVTISGNIVRNSNQASGGYGSLSIENATHCVVTGNIVYDEAGHLYSGGGINESATSDYNYITGNIIGALGVGANQYNLYGAHTLCEAAKPGVALNVKSALQVQHKTLDITTLTPGSGTRYDNVDIPANTGVLNIYGAGGAYSITGFVAGDDEGRQLTVVNNTAYNLTFVNTSANSTVGNRFQLSTNPSNLVVAPYCTANFVYSEITGTGIWVNI